MPGPGAHAAGWLRRDARPHQPGLG